MAPREIYGISFQFHRDFDQQGILFYIGTNSGTEPWKNPALTGRVKVTASSMEKGQASYITDYKEPHECWTKDIPASWFQLDLGPNRRVLPNYYTIRHGGNYKADRFFFLFFFLFFLFSFFFFSFFYFFFFFSSSLIFPIILDSHSVPLSKWKRYKKIPLFREI